MELERKIDELESEALRNEEMNTSASMPEPKPSLKPKTYGDLGNECTKGGFR